MSVSCCISEETAQKKTKETAADEKRGATYAVTQQWYCGAPTTLVITQDGPTDVLFYLCSWAKDIVTPVGSLSSSAFPSYVMSCCFFPSSARVASASLACGQKMDR